MSQQQSVNADVGWRCEIELPTPEEWVPLDLDTDDPRSWADQLVSEHIPRAVAERREALVAELLEFRDIALGKDAALACVRLAGPTGPVAAFLHIVPVPDPSLTGPESVAEIWRQQRPYVLRSPEISTVQLPAGPAGRLREVSHNGEGADDLIEYVTHAIFSPELPGMLEVTLTWNSLAFGEEYSVLADQIARSLRVVTA